MCRHHLALLFVLLPAWVAAAPAGMPHVSEAARAGYREYLQAEPHKAFAIAPGGAWSWRAGLASPEAALDAALADCGEHTRQTCVAYARDARVVFDARRWPTLWAPYRTAVEAARAQPGVGRGERFPDLACRLDDGRRQTLSAMRGRILVLHFWGSWCGPCRKELPDFQKLRARLRGVPEVAFLFTQVREPAAVSRAWLKAQGLDLALCDSGASGGADDGFSTADGARLNDRELARAFPSTYVLDANGLVLFSHTGPVADWAEYLPFLRHAAAHAARRVSGAPGSVLRPGPSPKGAKPILGQPGDRLERP